MFVTVIPLKYALLISSGHMDILNQQIQFYLNNTINLRPLTPHILPCCVHKDYVTALHPIVGGPKKWGHRLMTIIVSTLNRLVFFTERFLGKFGLKLVLKIPTDSILFEQYDKSSPLNSTHFTVLCSQNDDRIVIIDYVTAKF